MDDSGQIVPPDLTSVLEAALQLAPVPMLATDTDGRLLRANDSWLDLVGLGPGSAGPESAGPESAGPESAGRGPGGRAEWLKPLDPIGRRRFEDALTRAREGSQVEIADAMVNTPSGRRWTRWWMQKRTLAGQELLLMATVDFHEEVSQRDDLRELATHDDLTGLVNRRFFVETVEQALRRAERFLEPACVLFVDLDGFKAINDRAGHLTGDRVLRAVAARLRLAVRAADVVARIGGDEFAVLIERLSGPDGAVIVARRIEAALNGSVEVSGEGWPVSASVGMAMSRGGGDSALDLVARADEAMYNAKRAQGPAPLDLRELQESVDGIRKSLERLMDDLEQVRP
jgi:diguanylate cyclase (GGDEF)-like protein